MVTTGDVASEEIKQDLLGAKQIGQKRLQQFVQHRLIKKDVKFHKSVKLQKLRTFETLYAVAVSLDNSKTVAIKADRDLLRRVVVALESGRNVDVDLPERELSPVQMAIATLDGSFRQATRKSDLGSILLQENVCQSHSPVN